MKKLLFTLFTLLLCTNANAAVTVCTNCSTIVTQLIEKATSIADYAESVQQTYQQATQMQYQFQQYQNMLQNTGSLSLDSIDGVKSLIRELSYTGDRIEVIGSDIHAIDDMIEDLYGVTTQGHELPDFNTDGMKEYKAQVKETSALRRQQIKNGMTNLLRMTGIQLGKDKADVDNYIDSTDGQKEALDQITMVNALMVEELQSQKELTMQQAQMEAIMYGDTLKEKEQEEAYSEKFNTAPSGFWDYEILDDPI